MYGLGSFVRGTLRVSHLRRSARLRCFCAGQTEAMRCETCCVDRRNPLFSGALETCRSRKTLPSIDPILSPCAWGTLEQADSNTRLVDRRGPSFFSLLCLHPHPVRHELAKHRQGSAPQRAQVQKCRQRLHINKLPID